MLYADKKSIATFVVRKDQYQYHHLFYHDT